MLDDANAGRDAKGVWLWTLVGGLTLFLMEFILFAALIPTDWARTVSQRELTSLVDTLGPEAADRILDRGVRWYRTVALRSGLHAWSHRVLLPDRTPRTGRPDGMEPLGQSPGWDWLEDRLRALWWSVGQACLRLSVGLWWWPWWLVLGIGTVGDAWLRRRIRQHSSAYASPLIHAGALRLALVLVLIVLLLLIAPLPLPATAPVWCGGLLALLTGLAVANSQKRL